MARAVIGLMVMGHYPLAFVPARVAFTDMLSSLFNVAEPAAGALVAFTLLFVGSSLATALVVRAGAVVGAIASAIAPANRTQLLPRSLALLPHCSARPALAPLQRLTHTRSPASSARHIMIRLRGSGAPLSPLFHPPPPGD